MGGISYNVWLRGLCAGLSRQSDTQANLPSPLLYIGHFTFTLHRSLYLYLYFTQATLTLPLLYTGHFTFTFTLHKSLYLYFTQVTLPLPLLLPLLYTGHLNFTFTFFLTHFRFSNIILLLNVTKHLTTYSAQNRF
jgi:hypothetical protein